MDILSHVGLFSVFQQSPSLWISLYLVYTLIAAVPLLPYILPFPEDLKKTTKGRTGLFGTYLFFFFIAVFISAGPAIIQTYFLVLTLGSLMGTILLHIVLGAIFFHLIPIFTGKGVARAASSKLAGAIFAGALFYLVMVPVYFYSVWALTYKIFS